VKFTVKGLFEALTEEPGRFYIDVTAVGAASAHTGFDDELVDRPTARLVLRAEGSKSTRRCGRRIWQTTGDPVVSIMGICAAVQSDMPPAPQVLGDDAFGGVQGKLHYFNHGVDLG
jgi:hypothetical protein